MIDPDFRCKFEKNVCLGGDVKILSGVTIEDNSIIGTESIVTKSIPDNIIAVGNPCRIIRKITEENKIQKDLVKKLLSYNVGKDIHRNIYLDDKWIIEYEIEGLVEFHKESGYGFNIDDLSKYQNQEVAKVFFLGENKEIEDLEKKMKKDFKDELSITVSSPFCLEFMKKGVNKAETLKKVLKILDIKPEEVIAFGDSMNDYEMLSLVGKPFIMGNANKRLIEALPNVEVIGNNNEDGIGEKLQEIFNVEI